jgi:hypothetical protein
MLKKLLSLMPNELMVIAADIRIIYQTKEQAATAITSYYQARGMSWGDIVAHYWH